MITKQAYERFKAEIIDLEKRASKIRSQFSEAVVQASPLPSARVMFTKKELAFERTMMRATAAFGDGLSALAEIERRPE